MRIAHRINKLDESISAEIFAIADGIEFDIRDLGDKIIVHHDAFGDPEEAQDFEDFLRFCPQNKFYIVNIKAEGIEFRTLELLKEHNIHNFFLLDCSIPMIVRLGKSGEWRIAVRLSEYESIETVLALKDFVSWVWIDVFTQLPPGLSRNLQLIQNAKLKTCLVSPELQGQPEKITEYSAALQSLLYETNIKLNAVCTKLPFISKNSWPYVLFHDPS
jgi:hypothetical protein